MYIFILLSLHIGILAIVTGTVLSTRHNWTRGNVIVTVISGIHCAAWSLAYVGLVIETFGGVR